MKYRDVFGRWDRVNNSVTNAIKRQQYLPHLDGLRAIAVLFVMIYHTDLGILPGGFIGVDIFFVLSGFLITNQLSQAMVAGEFRFRDFYLRRIRRLVPAYIAVSIATMVVGYYLLLPEDFIYHAKLTGLAFLSVGNFYIENTGEGYFAAQSAEIPLLHTWSLSVEEQFYLVWPMLLLLLYKIGGYGKRLLILGGGFVLCLWWSQWQAEHDPTVAYYLLPARFSELLVGALLAIGINWLPTLSVRVANSLQGFGLAVLMGVAILFGADTVFPGVNAMVVCLTTGLLIYAGVTPSVISTLLSTRLMVVLGQLSYSLYLWHWPVFAFWRYIEGSLTVLQVGVALTLSLLLAFLSWQFIEKPFRYRLRGSFARTFGLLYAMPLVAILVLFFFIDLGRGLPERFGNKQTIVEAIESKPGDYDSRCGPNSVPDCKNLLLVGDSHAEHFGPFLSVFTGSTDRLFITSKTNGFCLPLIGLVPIKVGDGGLTKEVNEACVQRNARVFADLSEYRYVVLAGYWSFPQIKPGQVFYGESMQGLLSLEVSMDVLEKAFFATVETIIDQGSVPVIIMDNPTIPLATLKCSYKRVLYQQLDKPCSVSRSDVDEQKRLVKLIFAALAEKFPQVRVIDPLDQLCDQLECATLLGEMPLYRDQNHLNAVGSQLLGERYLGIHGSPFNH